MILFHIPRKKPRKFISLGYRQVKNIHEIYEKHQKQARAALSQNIFINIMYKHGSFPSWPHIIPVLQSNT